MERLFTDLRGASRQQALLRSAVVVAALVYSVLLVLAGDSTPLALVVLGALGLLCVVNPHTQAPTLLILYMLAAWGAGVPSAWHPLTLPAALCLLVVHVACALAAGVPSAASLPGALRHLYGPRLIAVALATTVVWAVAGAVAATGTPGGIVAALTGLGVVTIGLVTHYVTVTRPTRSTGRRRPERIVDQRERPREMGLP